MACYNGKAYVAQQIESIAQQKNCVTKLVISIDLSDDGTLDYIKDLNKQYAFIHLLSYGHRYGSAAANFYRLIMETDIQGYDFIAYSDQDDIWNDDKLSNHIQLARKNNADGVSSNVMAFWTDNRETLITKAQPQKEWDYLFESPGPGCTFLITPWLLNKVRDQLLNEKSPAKKVAFHDWLTYAVCRAYGHKWIIDSVPSVRYRQHGNNVFGANSGFKAKIARLLTLKQGWYKEEVIKICALSVSISKNTKIYNMLSLCKSKSICSQYKLLPYVLQARRKFFDRVLLGLIILSFQF